MTRADAVELDGVGLPTSPPVVVIAPDKFKGTLSAAQVADALDAGLRAGNAAVVTRPVPVADGGDGSLDAAVRAGFAPTWVAAATALGQPARARIGRRAGTAIVEVAEICGLSRVPHGQRNPMAATSLGVGLATRAALDMGVRTVVLAIGGSASTDGGAGFLQALGARFYDHRGDPVRLGGAGLLDLARADLNDLDARLGGTEFVLASDVDNPLLGPQGAARIYGPQKGAEPGQVEQLETALTRLAGLLANAPVALPPSRAAQVPGAGAAGGLGFAALLAGARVRSGADFFLDLVGFDDAVAGASLVVTGEGSLDAQSLSGKAPIVVASRAARAGVPTVAVAGRCTLPPGRWATAQLRAVHALDELDPGCATDPALSGRLLGRIGRDIAASLRTQRAPAGALHPP